MSFGASQWTNPSGPGAAAFGGGGISPTTPAWSTYGNQGVVDQQNAAASSSAAYPPASPSLYPPVSGPYASGSGAAHFDAPVAAPGVGLVHFGAAPNLYPPASPVIDYPPVTPESWDTDLQQPGALEAWNKAHGSDFTTPGPSQTFDAAHGGDFTAPDANAAAYNAATAAGPLANNAQAEYNAFGGKVPNISSEPGYGAYYDNAIKNSTNSINTELGARGAYGSSVGLGQLGKSITDLRSDQAQHEADYNLNRLAEQRNWDSLGGTLARNADLSGQGNLDTMGTLANNASSSYQTGLSNASNAADSASRERLSGLTGGATAAGAAQGAREGRIQGALTNISGATGTLQGIYGQMWDSFLAGDLSLSDAQQAALIGKLRDQVNAGNQQQQAATSGSAGLAAAAATLL